MEEVSTLSLFTVTHVKHDPKWMTSLSSCHNLICLACASEMLQDSSVPNAKKKFILSGIHTCLKESDDTFPEFLVNHENFAWHLADIVFEEIQKNNDLTLQISAEVLSQLCCCLESDELVYGILQKIFTKIGSGCSAHLRMPFVSLLRQLLDSIPALAETLVENSDLMQCLVRDLSSADESVAFQVIGLLSKLLGSSSIDMAQVPVVEEVCRQTFPVISSTQNQKVLQGAVEATGVCAVQCLQQFCCSKGLVKTMVESAELVGVVIKIAFTTNQPTLASVIKKVLHTRREELQIDAVQIIGQLLSKSGEKLEELGENLLDADLAEFLFEHLSTTNQTLLCSIFCSLLLMTEVNKFFQKCHSVLGIDPILRAAEQYLSLNLIDALHYGLELLSVIFAKHPDDQRLLSGVDMFQHTVAFLSKCVLHCDYKISLPGMKCMKHIFRKDYIPIPIDFANLISPVKAAVSVIGQFPQPLPRGIKRHLTNRNEMTVQQSVHSKLAKQEEAVLLTIQLVENAFRLAMAIREDQDMYEESQFTAPIKHDANYGDCNHANGLLSFTQFLLGILDRDIIPTIMINYEVFHECSSPLFSSFLRTLYQASEMDVTLDLHKKLVSSSFIQWSMEIKAKFYPDSSISVSVDDFISSLCSKLLTCTPRPSPSSLHASLKAALKPCRDINALCAILTDDGEETVSNLGRSSSGASILERQEGCLAVLYCGWYYDDRLISDDSLLEMLVHFMMHRTDQELSEVTLKHLLFLFACVDHAGERNTQSEGTSVLLRMMDHTQRQAVYSHHPHLIKWCFSSSFIPSQFCQEMLELWMERIDIQEEDNSILDEEVKFFLLFLSSNQACFLALLNLFITTISKGITGKILTLLQLLFRDNNQEIEIPNSSRLIGCLQKHLPEMQRKVLIQQEKDVKIGSRWFINLLALLSSVYTNGSDTIELGSSDLKLVFQVIKALSGSDRVGPATCGEDTLMMLNYLTAVLLMASSSGDSRVASMMLSSEFLLRRLHQLATEKPSSSLEAIFTAKSKLKYQSVFLTAYLIAASAKFKVKPEVSLLWDVGILFGCLTKTDVCSKVSSLQFLTSVFETNFESQFIQIQDKCQQRVRPNDDVGLALSAGTIRSFFFMLQNILLQGSDFAAWNSLLCMSSLLKYVCSKNKKLSDHLIHQPWNGFLVECCHGFYKDSLPPAWFIRFLMLFPTKVPQKSFEATLNAILEQSPETLDYRMLGSAVTFIKEHWNTINTNQALAERCQEWMKRAKLIIQGWSEVSPVEMLHINGVVLSVDMTFLDRNEDTPHTICGLGT